METILVLGYRQSGRTARLVSKLVEAIASKDWVETPTFTWVCRDSFEESDVIKMILDIFAEKHGRTYPENRNDQEEFRTLLTEYDAIVGFIHYDHEDYQVSHVQQLFSGVIDSNEVYIDDFDHLNSGTGPHMLGLSDKLQYVKDSRSQLPARKLYIATSIPSEWYPHFLEVRDLPTIERQDAIYAFLESELYSQFYYMQYATELWLTYSSGTFAFESEDEVGVEITGEELPMIDMSVGGNTIMMEDLPIGEDYAKFVTWIADIRLGLDTAPYFDQTNLDNTNFVVEYVAEIESIVVGPVGYMEGERGVLASNHSFKLPVPKENPVQGDSTITSTFGLVVNAINAFKEGKLELGIQEFDEYTKAINDRYLETIKDALTRVGKHDTVAFVTSNNSTTHIILGLANAIISEKEQSDVYVPQHNLAYDLSIGIINRYFTEKGLKYIISPANKYLHVPQAKSCIAFLFTDVSVTYPHAVSRFAYIYNIAVGEDE